VKIDGLPAGYVERYIAQEFAKVDDFITARYTAAALAGIALHGEPTDALLTRELLHMSASKDIGNNVRIHALKYLRRCGSATDAALAIQIAKTSESLFGDLRNEVLK
jgi:hypothetical protein